jgi:hypothetical protein
MVDRALSSRRLSQFFWEHRFHPLLFPLILAWTSWMHGALLALSVLAQGGQIVGWQLVPANFQYAPGPSEREWLVVLPPVVFWVALSLATACIAPGQASRRRGRMLAIFGILAPIMAVSGSTAIPLLEPQDNFFRPLWQHPVATIAVTAALGGVIGRLAWAVYRELWDQPLSRLEFGLAWTTFLLLPWVFMAGHAFLLPAVG